MIVGEKTLRHLLALLDDGKAIRIARYLFEIIFIAFDDKLFNLVIASKEPVCKLVESSNGDVKIYDFYYERVFV